MAMQGVKSTELKKSLTFSQYKNVQKMVSEDRVRMGTGRLFHATGEVTKNVWSSQVDHWVSE